eukprot:1327420-Amorphochlora_amoeboformis.AAC.1
MYTTFDITLGDVKVISRPASARKPSSSAFWGGWGGGHGRGNTRIRMYVFSVCVRAFANED